MSLDGVVVLEEAIPAALGRLGGQLGKEVDADLFAVACSSSTTPKRPLWVGHRDTRRRAAALAHDDALLVDALPLAVVGQPRVALSADSVLPADERIGFAFARHASPLGAGAEAAIPALDRDVGEARRLDADALRATLVPAHANVGGHVFAVVAVIRSDRHFDERGRDDDLGALNVVVPAASCSEDDEESGERRAQFPGRD